MVPVFGPEPLQFGEIGRIIAVYNGFHFDFILLSNHQIGNQEFWNQEFQAGKSQEEFHTAYSVKHISSSPRATARRIMSSVGAWESSLKALCMW